MAEDNPQVGNFEKADIASLSLEQKQAFATQMFKRGFSRDEVMQKLGLNDPATQPVIQPANSERVQVLLSPDSGITYEQKVSGYKALLKHTTDPAVVIAAAAREGIILTPEAADTKSRLTRDQQLARAIERQRADETGKK